MVVVQWIIPLAKGVAIVEGPITNDRMIECLISYHPVAGDWVILVESENIIGSQYLDER